MKSRVPALFESSGSGRWASNEGGSRKTLVEERFVNRLRQEVLPDVDGHARSRYSQRFTVQRTIETKTRGNTVVHVAREIFSLSFFLI